VRVTGLTTLDAHARSDTRAATRIRGTLKGAQTVNETVTWVKDAESRRGETVMAEVTLKLCLSAPCDGSSLSAATFGSSQTTALPASTVEPSATMAEDTATALILDLNQALYLPSLAPQIRDEAGALVYSQNNVDPQILTEKGLIHYTQSLSEARALIGEDRPITVIDVQTISADNHIIISTEDARRLNDHAALKTAQVYVALD